MLSMNKLHHKF